MDLAGSIADLAAAGAVLGAAFALFFDRREELEEWTARGMVLGGLVGALSALARAVL
jgi:hypothetical protein